MHEQPHTPEDNNTTFAIDVSTLDRLVRQGDVDTAVRLLGEALAPGVAEQKAWLARFEPEAASVITEMGAKLTVEHIGSLAERAALYPLADRARALTTSYRAGRKRGAVNELTKLVRDYLAQHPQASPDAVLEHLKQCAEKVHQTIQDVTEVYNPRTRAVDHRVDWVTRQGAEKSTRWSTVQAKLDTLRPRP